MPTNAFRFLTYRFAKYLLKKRNLNWVALLLFFTGIIWTVGSSAIFSESKIRKRTSVIQTKATQDTWVSAYKGEQFGNNGNARKLKLKGRLENSLLDFDLQTLKGKRIRRVWLHLRPASVKNAPLMRIGVSTVASAWQEGTGKGYASRKGGATYLQARHQVQDWAYPRSTILDCERRNSSTPKSPLFEYPMTAAQNTPS